MWESNSMSGSKCRVGMIYNRHKDTTFQSSLESDTHNKCPCKAATGNLTEGRHFADVLAF